MTTWKVLAACAALLVAAAGVSLTQEAPTKDTDSKKAGKETTKPPKDTARPATQKVEKKPFKIDLVVKGILEPEQGAEVAFRAQPLVGLQVGPGPLVVRKAAEHGAKVKKGDVLLELDTRRIDQTISFLETDLRSADAAIKLAEEELPLLEKTLPLDLAAAERSKVQADEDLAYFLKVSRPESEKQAHQFVKMAKFSLEFAKEELRQLEKMYKANDLTEDTEEIVLRRQKHYVEMMEHSFKRAELSRDLTLKVELPRREQSARDNAVRQALALDRARTTLVPMMTQKQQALVKMRSERDKLARGLEMLRKDREAMTITSPADGTVFYGKFARGQWESAGTLAAKLTPNGVIPAEEVLMTVVPPGPLHVRVSVDEKDVHLLKAGLPGKAELTLNPERKLAARLEKVSPVPAVPGKFEALVTLHVPPGSPELVPGLACSIKFVPYARKDALTVATSSVVEEDDGHAVYVAGKDGKAEKRTVTPGRAARGRTEIVSGLVPGDEVLLEPPADRKAASTPEKGGAE
jgi:multidrug efflux pump subunit AcrA (membrane-fusion protein)